MKKQLEKKHPLAVRWLHWVNFPLLTMMIWSGILIYWANPVYGIRLFGYDEFGWRIAAATAGTLGVALLYLLLRRLLHLRRLAAHQCGLPGFGLLPRCRS